MPETIPQATSIVPRRPNGLSTRTAALVRRGIRDIGREANWVVKRIFTGRRVCTAVSSSGKVSVFLTADAPTGLRLAICDLDADIPPESVPASTKGSDGAKSDRGGSALLWSPTGRILLAASNVASNQL